MPFTQGICAQLQQALNEVAGQNAPGLKRDRVGYLEALQSAVNLNGVQRVAVPSDGKRRQVEVIYTPRGLESGVQTTRPTSFCDATDEPEPFSVTLDVDNWAHRKLRFTEWELRKLCYEAPSDYIANLVMGEMNALLVRANRQLITQQATNFGAFFDGTFVKNADFLDGSNQPVYFEESKILEEYARISGSGTPLLVGAGDLAHYTRMTGKGCCNQHGVDLSQAGDYAFFYDRFVDDVLTPPENYILLAPGAAQFLYWNANVGEFAWRDDRDEAGTVVDPFTGVRFDVDKVWDKCAKQYHVTITLNYDLFFLPANAFQAGDPLEGVNYTLRFQKS